MAALKSLLVAILVGLSILSATALQRSLAGGAADHVLKPKVFIIGLSKTGTTSLGDALAQLGYRRSGWEDLRSRWLYHRWARGGGSISALEAHTRRFDAFEDIPWPQVYREMADLYPTARFILSVRRDDDTWLRSCVSHTARRQWEGHRDLYGCLEARECPELYRAAYLAHNDEVRRFFASRGEEQRLLEFVIDGAKEGSSDHNVTTTAAEVHPSGEDKGTPDDRVKWSILLDFLNSDGQLGEGIDVDRLGEFPRSNSKTSFGNRDPLGLYWSIDQCLFFVESALLKMLDSTTSFRSAYRIQR